MAVLSITYEKRKKGLYSDHRDHGGDGEGQGLRHPVGGHQHYEVGTLHGLQQLRQGGGRRHTSNINTC